MRLEHLTSLIRERLTEQARDANEAIHQCRWRGCGQPRHLIFHLWPVLTVVHRPAGWWWTCVSLLVPKCQMRSLRATTMLRYQAVKLLSRPSAVRFSSDFNKAGPPQLPKELQKEFEELQKAAAEKPNPAVVRKPYAEFDGDKNPETGEVGGPKQDPLRHGDYSFKGRVTDF